jgi:hypothetical protein
MIPGFDFAFALGATNVTKMRTEVIKARFTRLRNRRIGPPQNQCAVAFTHERYRNSKETSVLEMTGGCDGRHTTVKRVQLLSYRRAMDRS